MAPPRLKDIARREILDREMIERLLVARRCRPGAPSRPRGRRTLRGGGMGPKIKSTLRFIEAGGERAVITSLDRVAHALAGRGGTVIEAEAPSAA